MELRTLRYFVVAVEAGSLSKAAALLHIAQPALTAQIKKLEGELGAQLLERSPAGVTATQAGMELYRDATRLLSDADAIRERLLRAGSEPEGSVTLALPFLLTSLLTGPLIVRLRERYPRIRLFVLDELSLRVRKAMEEGRSDIAILVDTPRCDGLQCAPLVEEDLFLCGFDRAGDVASELVAGAGEDGIPAIRFDAAARLPLVLQSPRFAVRQSVEEAAAQRGVRLNIVHEHDASRVIRSLYLAGAGYTFTPACAFAEYPMSGPAWVRARVVDPQLVRRYYLATPAGRPLDTAADIVANLLHEVVRDMVGAGTWQARLCR